MPVGLRISTSCNFALSMCYPSLGRKREVWKGTSAPPHTGCRELFIRLWYFSTFAIKTGKLGSRCWLGVGLFFKRKRGSNIEDLQWLWGRNQTMYTSKLEWSKIPFCDYFYSKHLTLVQINTFSVWVTYAWISCHLNIIIMLYPLIKESAVCN